MSLTKYKIGPELRRILHKSGHWQHWFSVRLDSDALKAESLRLIAPSAGPAHVPIEHRADSGLDVLDLAAYHLICQQRSRPWFQHAIEYFLHHPNPRLEALKIAWAILLLLLLALCARSAHAQAGSDVGWTFKLTAGTPRSSQFDNRSRGCTTFHLTYFSVGNTANAIEADWAPDNNGTPGAWNTWTDLPAGSSLPLTDTVASQISLFRYKPWISVNLNSSAGGGTVYGTLTCRPASANNNASFSGDQISSNQGTANTLANAWPVKVTDGVTAVSLTGSSLNVNCTAGCGGGGAVDVSDRAARLLGVIYGSQAAQIKQTAVNFNSQVELATGATLYDARQIRALTSSDVLDISDRAGRALGVVASITSAVDVSDRAARLLGHVTVDSAPTTAVTVASLPLPSNAAQETGGNLATIATNSATQATAARQDTGNASLASIDSKMPAQVNSSQPVTIVNPQAIMPPPISAATAANPLLFRAAMQQFCRTNLCTGVK